MKLTKQFFFRNIILFLLYGEIYYTIETIYKMSTSGNTSHWTMFLLGGFCALIIGLLNENSEWETPVLPQAIVSTIFILVCEFVTGMIVNVWLGWNIWDYSDMAYNFKGQVCPQFAGAWLVLSVLTIYLDDFLRVVFFGEETKEYVLLRKPYIPLNLPTTKR